MIVRLLGRSRELGRLRSALDRREPHLVVVSGIRGGGKSSLVRHAMADYSGVIHVCPPLPDPAQRALLAERIRALEEADRNETRSSGSGSPAPVRGGGRARSTPDGDPSSDASWEELTEALLRRLDPGSRPFVLVLDDAHRLGEARSRHLEPIGAALARAASEDLTLHVVLVGHEISLPDATRPGGRRGAGPEADDVRTEHIEVGPLPFRAAAARLPGRRAHDRVRAYGVFGGIPSVLARLDDTVTVGTNVRRLLLAPDGPLADAGAAWLERDLQAPARYYAIMRTLAEGEADWGTLHAGVSDLTRSGQVAPYLKRLSELGLVEPRRSIDASPRSRSRRYAITDPFLAFWFRFVLPYRLRPERDAAAQGEGDHYARAVRPLIEEHMDTVFPVVCRQHMALDAIETLGAVAREGGSLWGPGYDLPVAGILTSGAAYYGACRWRHDDDRRPPLEEIEHDMRETRYGFGRELRIRLVFTGRPAPASLRRAVVRNQDAELIDAEALAG